MASENSYSCDADDHWQHEPIDGAADGYDLHHNLQPEAEE